MKPVAVNPNISFTQLVEELGTVNDTTAAATIVDQLLAKLQRQQRKLGDSNRDADTGDDKSPASKRPLTNSRMVSATGSDRSNVRC